MVFRALKTPEDIARDEERREKLRILVFKTGTIRTYARKIGMSYHAIESALRGRSRVSDRALGQREVR